MSEENKKVVEEASKETQAAASPASDAVQSASETSQPASEASSVSNQQVSESLSVPAQDQALPNLNDYNQQAQAAPVNSAPPQADPAYQAPANQEPTYQAPNYQDPSYAAGNNTYPNQEQPQTGAYANAYQLQPEIPGETYVMRHSDTWDTLYLIAFILSLISTVFLGLLLIPLAWMIPMTVHLWGIYKGKKAPSTAFSVCTLLFLNLVAGILMLVADSKE